jgi:8-oxo-dGTP pyrophosphatase MutT (NUDIX family)
MKKDKLRNFPFNHNGEELWYSRSITVVGHVTVYEDDDDNYNYDEYVYYTLAIKRGKGCPAEQGKWCLPCGYLDFDETLKEAVNREVFEETGIRLDVTKWKLGKVDSTPTGRKQNVTMIYNYVPEWEDRGNMGVIRDELTSIHDTRLVRTAFPETEGDEVEEVRWIKVEVKKNSENKFCADYSEVDKLEWAFGHDKLIKV